MDSNNTTIRNAALWLAAQKETPHPVVPTLRDKFSLSTMEAIAAIREAQLMRGRSH